MKMGGVCVVFFFFSSRRRHTRWPRDWSSDVCSSDLSPCSSVQGSRCPAPARRCPEFGSLTFMPVMICKNRGLMDEQEFYKRADEALSDLYKLLSRAADDGGFEPDFNNGALSIEFDDEPARFVVSPNSPVRQIWVSARSKSYKLDWDDDRRAFILPETGATLTEVIQDAISRQLGHEVNL